MDRIKEYDESSSAIESNVFSQGTAAARAGHRLSHLGHATAQALGVAVDTNFNKLKKIQEYRAGSIGGLTQGDRRAEALLNKLAETADIQGNVRLSRKDRKQASSALRKDLQRFQQTSRREPSPSSSQLSYIDIEQLTEGGADVDEETLKMIAKYRQPSGAERETTRRPSQPKQQMVSAVERKERADEFQRKMSMMVPLEKETAPNPMKTTREPSLSTLYQNAYDSGSVSRSVYNVRRFFSKTKTKMSAGSEPWDAQPFVSLTALEKRVWGEVDEAMRRLTAQPPTDLQDINELGLINPGNGEPPLAENLDETQFGDVDKKALPPNADSGDFLYGAEAFRHYRTYKAYEKRVLDEVVLYNKRSMRDALLKKKKSIEHALTAAKDHYAETHDRSMAFRSRLKSIKKALYGEERMDQASTAGHEEEQRAAVRSQLESIPTYTPWFMYVITALQIIVTGASVFLAGTVRVGIQPIKIVSEQTTWQGYTEVVHYGESNVWIGPSMDNLTRLGAMFAPCMRPDQMIGSRLAQYRSVHEGGQLGCCEITGIGAGTMTQKECEQLVTQHKIPDYLWSDSSTCANRPLSAVSRREFHKFKPCCFGHKGDCQLMTHSHCTLVQGKWHSKVVEHCSQAHCDEDVCLFWAFSHNDDDQANEEEQLMATLAKNTTTHNHAQYWRLPASLLLHNGIIHVVLVSVVQLIMGTQVEMLAGWLRVAVIYLTTGLSGLLFGSTMTPLVPTMGGGGAVSGLVAVYLVELFQAWSLVPRPYMALLKIVGIMALFGTAGFLPQVNQFVQIGGFVMGLLMATICLPYVTFNYWHSKARIIVICVSGSLVLGLTLVGWILFHSIQPYDIGVLKTVNCLPLIKDMCDDGLT